MLQGFPEDFVLAGSNHYAQVGNAVAPPVVRVVAEALLKALGFKPVKATASQEEGVPCEPCETSLAPASLILLNSISQPPNRIPSGGCADGHHMDCAEQPMEMQLERDACLAHVVARPIDLLYCRACACTYNDDDTALEHV